MHSALFIAQPAHVPSARVRVHNLLPELERYGVAAQVTTYPEGYRQRWQLLRHCRRFDSVVVQKLLLPPLDLWLLRRACDRLLFDFDDAIYYRQERQDERSTRARKFAAMARAADLVIAGNRILAQRAARHARRVEILASGVESRGIPLQDHAAVAGPVVIGWVGTPQNLPYLALLEPVLTELARRHAIELRVVSSAPLAMAAVPTRFLPWRLDGQEAEIARFDIGVMPLPDDRYTQGKCGYKALQYMAAAVPVVVSDVGSNADSVTHGENGFVAPAIGDFLPALTTLVEQPELRRRLGERARRTVEQGFCIEVIGRRLAGVIQGGAGG